MSDFEYPDFITSTRYGEADGLCGSNCKHSFSGYIPGVSPRLYTDEELDELIAKENEKKEFEGKEYTTYEATQYMRKLERNMRAQREKIHLLELAEVDDERITLAKCKYQKYSQTYTAFAKKMGLPQERARVYGDGLGRGGKTTRTAAEKVNNVKESIENAVEDGIMKSGARILDPNTEAAEKFAKMYYEEIRHFSTDCMNIAINTGYLETEIRAVKEYLFFTESFKPDCAIAQSWQRLMLNDKIKEHDKTLIKHELYEMQIKRENPNISHSEAHKLATEKYNYQKEVDEYYGNFAKNKEKQ